MLQGNPQRTMSSDPDYLSSMETTRTQDFIDLEPLSVTPFDKSWPHEGFQKGWGGGGQNLHNPSAFQSETQSTVYYGSYQSHYDFYQPPNEFSYQPPKQVSHYPPESQVYHPPPPPTYNTPTYMMDQSEACSYQYSPQPRHRPPTVNFIREVAFITWS